jgi:hypothetical protein
MNKTTSKILIICNLIAFITTLIVNTLSNSLPLNGKTPGQLSDLYPNLFVPAGLTFSIWGIIYTWLLIFIIWQVSALFNAKHMKNIAPIIDKLSWSFVITCILNIAWLFAWHWQFLFISVIIMLTLLLSLIRLNNQMDTGIYKINSSEKWLIHAPFGIYLGWISVATIANITAILVSIRWNRWGLSEGNWAFIMIFAGFLIASSVVRIKNNVFYGLAVIWALYGIMLKRGTEINEVSQQIERFTFYALIALAIVVIWRLKAWLKY